MLNLDTKACRIEKAEGLVQPTIFYRAETMESREPTLYNLFKARVTSCSQPVPRWTFSMSRGNIKKDDYIKMWNAIFRIKNVPVFYWPYISYPLNKDRATGFLMPRIGASNNKGFTFEESFYWAIARNMDATIDFDYYSAKGIGGGLEYRYLFGGGTGGEVSFYGFTFKKNASEEKLDNASVFRWKHNQTLPFGFTFSANVDMSSSYAFLREFDNNFRRATVSNRRSEVYLQRSWSYFNLSARVSKVDTYSSASQSSIISKSLPQVNFSMFKTKLFSPFLLSFNSSFYKWQYGDSNQFEKGTQRKSGNFQFAPTLTLPFTSIPWLTLTASATAKYTYYFSSYRPNSSTPIDEPLLTKDYAAGVEVLGPVFSRTFRNKAGDPSFKHVIEPFIKYNYETPIEEFLRIYSQSTYFAPYRYHQIQYGITNRFFTREKDMAREVLQIALSQTYYLAPDEGPLSRYLLEDGSHPQRSEILGTLRYYPGRWSSLDVSAGWNPYYKVISSLRLGAGIGNRAEGEYFSLSWFKSSNIWDQSEWSRLLGRRHQISASAGLKLPLIPVDVTGDIDYNIQEKKLQYTALTSVYHYQCLDFSFELRVFYFRTKPETQFKFSIGLGNIGKTTDFLGGFNF